MGYKSDCEGTPVKSKMSKDFAGKAKMGLRDGGKLCMADGGSRSTVDMLRMRGMDINDAVDNGGTGWQPSAAAPVEPKAPVAPVEPVVSQPNIVSRGIDAAWRAWQGMNDSLSMKLGDLGFAHGGMHVGPGRVEGPGGPREDMVPAMYSDGEYVLPAKTVAALGGPERLDEVVRQTNDGREPGPKVTRRGLRAQDGLSPLDYEVYPDGSVRQTPASLAEKINTQYGDNLKPQDYVRNQQFDATQPTGPRAAPAQPQATPQPRARVNMLRAQPVGAPDLPLRAGPTPVDVPLEAGPNRVHANEPWSQVRQPAPAAPAPAAAPAGRAARAMRAGKGVLRGAGRVAGPVGLAWGAYEGLQGAAKLAQDLIAPERPDFIKPEMHTQIQKNRGLDDSYGYDILRGKFTGGQTVAPGAGDPVTGANPVHVAPPVAAPAEPEQAPAAAPAAPAAPRDPFAEQRARDEAAGRLQNDIEDRTLGMGLRVRDADRAEDDVTLARANQMYGLRGDPISVARDDRGVLEFSGSGPSSRVYTGVDGRPTTNYEQSAQYAEGVARADRDTQALNAAIAGRIAAGDLEGANQLAATPEQRAMVNAGYGQRRDDEKVARMGLRERVAYRNNQTAKGIADARTAAALAEGAADRRVTLRGQDITERNNAANRTLEAVKMAQQESNRVADNARADRAAQTATEKESSKRLDDLTRSLFPQQQGADGKWQQDEGQIAAFNEYRASFNEPITYKGKRYASIDKLPPAAQDMAVRELKKRFDMQQTANANQGFIGGKVANSYSPEVGHRPARFSDVAEGVPLGDVVSAKVLPWVTNDISLRGNGQRVLRDRLTNDPNLGQAVDLDAAEILERDRGLRGR